MLIISRFFPLHASFLNVVYVLARVSISLASVSYPILLVKRPSRRPFCSKVILSTFSPTARPPPPPFPLIAPPPLANTRLVSSAWITFHLLCFRLLPPTLTGGCVHLKVFISPPPCSFLSSIFNQVAIGVGQQCLPFSKISSFFFPFSATS